MNWSAFRQLYVANFKEFIRDRMGIFWTVAFPVFFIVLFGIIFSGGGTTTFGVGVVVEDPGQLGASLGKAFSSVPAFRVTEGTRDEMVEKLKQGELDLVVVVPEGMSEAVTAGDTADVEVFYDPSNQTTSQVVLTIVEKVVEGFDQQVTQRPTLLVVKPSAVTAEGLRAIDYLLPGILAMSLMQLGLFATAPALVQLREQQVLRRIGATPLPRSTLLSTQVAFRLTIGLAQTLIIIVVGTLLFGVQVIGSLAMLAGVVLLGAMVFILMGYMISGLAKTQESAVGISQFVNFPMMFLSGIFFPLTLMPAWIQPVVAIMPLTYLGDALRQIMVGAPPAYPLGVDVVVLGVWLVVCAVLAVRLFKWE
jgi:ABC-2 type transport system permease protein